MEKAYKLQFAEEESGSLYLGSCGLSKTAPHHSFGPAVKPHYIIHFVISGKGLFRIRGNEYSLSQGQGFLIPPGELAYYEADGEDPWTYVWVGFFGTRSPQTVLQLGLSSASPIFRSTDADRIYQIVHDMTDRNTFSASDVLARNGLLQLFLSVIADSTVNEKNAPAGSNNYVQKAIGYIRDNYFNPIKVTDIAAFVCVNRSYLYSLFQQSLGVSPQQYLTSYRISKAVELLQLTDLSVESIAISCGYSDPMVFSKAFRQEKGSSPSAFRKDFRTNGTLQGREHLRQVEAFIEGKEHSLTSDPQNQE